MNPLDYIGAAACGEPVKEDTHGRPPEGAGRAAESRDAAPEQAGGGYDAASHGLLLRSADVRSVRREDRIHPVTKEVRRLVVADWIASTEAEDSYESILIADWDKDGRLDRFRRNPVLLWAHNNRECPAIGHCENVRVEKNQLLLTVVCDDTTEFDREIAEKIEKRVIRAGSVGFSWGKAELRTVGDREVVVFSQNELREFSICNVGSNPEALAQRELVAVARDLARVHGSVGVRDVVARLREQKAARTLQHRSLPPAAPAQPITPPQASPGTGEPMATPSKKIVQADERAVRATDDGATLEVSCPHCDAPVEVQARTLPVSTKRAAEIEALQKRTTEADGKVAETERKLALTTTELDAAKARVAALEPQLAEATKQNEAHQRKLVEAEVDKRIGSKVFAAERASEVKHLLALLANRAPDPDSKDAQGNPTRTLGEKEYAERLGQLDARPDLGLLGPAITGPDQKPNSGAAPTQSRSAVDEINAIAARPN